VTPIVIQSSGLLGVRHTYESADSNNVWWPEQMFTQNVDCLCPSRQMGHSPH